ncbi:MAG: HypC/HybG/HupF family hydrogenase formation chaperone [Candidatus Methanosuratus sp.]|nr:HypC/HybG/HupF family hydrogenase formation chaperone [Candidatus Methanosuratincola sp.]
MCLAVPGRVTKIDGEKAEVDISGIRREASLALVSDQGIKVGDYVLVHTGYAITKLDEAEAEEILRAWEDVAAAERDG